MPEGGGVSETSVLERGAQEELPVIAIGVSAHGLDTCRAMLKTIPGDVQAAFVLIPHLDSPHYSTMVDLFAPHTQLKVVQASEGMPLRAGWLHVIPSDMFLTVAQHRIHLSERDADMAAQSPVDALLQPLARDVAGLSGGIVLAGTGADGGLEIGEIRTEDGPQIARRTTAFGLQNVLSSTYVATLILDPDLKIRFVARAAGAILDLKPTDVGRPLEDLVSVSSAEGLLEDVREVLVSSDPKERELADADGKWTLRRIQPLRNEGGAVEGAVITYVDINERKRIEADLQATTAEARRATIAKSRFLASASHDLRQPLQSMALLHELMARQRRTTEGARLARILEQTLNSMTGMLDSMLDVNRIDTGVVQPNLQNVAIAPLLQHLVEEFGTQCEAKHLKLRSVPCKAWIRTDPRLLEQMLRNLLSNALKFTQKGGILVGCRRRGRLLTILVCDTGTGVPEAESKAIFDAYYQSETSRGLSQHGLGLGLSIVQRLARLMEHPISMQSTPGKGSAFMITLPVVEEGSPDRQPEEAEPEAPAATWQTGRILFVEGEEPLRDLLTDILSQEGHEVIARADAPDALAWARGDTARPDLLLTDFDPRGATSGLTFAQDLQEVLGHAVPTIILTGDITDATAVEIARSNSQHCVKPVLPEVLLAMISGVLVRARAEKAGSARASDAPSTTVHVVDDDPTLRNAMRYLFEAEGWIVATYASAEDLLAASRPGGPTCILVDNRLPGMDGLALTRTLRAEGSRVPVIMLTGYGDAAMAVAAMKAGASDFLEKPAIAAELLASVRNAIKADNDGRPIPEQQEAARKRVSVLTAREREVLALVLRGAPSKIIAADLGIAQRTVENHRASVMRKIGARSLPELVRLTLAAEDAYETA